MKDLWRVSKFAYWDLEYLFSWGGLLQATDLPISNTSQQKKDIEYLGLLMVVQSYMS